jgi:putative addiction module component (TIGR02574 family)
LNKSWFEGKKMRIKDFPEIDKLSTEEKILLVEELWDNIRSNESVVPVLQSHKEELDQRLKKYQAAQPNLLSIEEIQEKIKNSK